MVFKFKAIDSENKIITGKRKSESEEEILEFLKENNLKVISLEKENKREDEKTIKKKIDKKELYKLLYNMYIMNSSGLNIPKILQMIAKNSKSKYKKVYKKLYKSVEQGNSLGKAMEEEKIFPDFVVNMVLVGEKSSNLANVFKDLSEFYKNSIKFERKIKNALYYPIFLITISFIIINFLCIIVLPEITNIFYSMPENIPKATKFIMDISAYWAENYRRIIITILLFVMIIMLFLKTYYGKKIFDYLKMKNEFYKKVQIKNFVNMLSVLINAEHTFYNAIKTVANSTENIIFSEYITEISENINWGLSFSNSIEKDDIFDERFIEIIKVSEKSSKLGQCLNVLCEYYEFEIKVKQEKFIKFIEPMVILVLGLIIGFIVISIAIPLLDIVDI